MSRIRKTLLSAGVKVITEEMADATSTTVGIWVRTGSRNERDGQRGISHFIEHLLFKGTKKRTSLQISKAIESVGGILNAFTSREYTCFYAKVLNKDVSLAVDVLSDIFLNSVFDKVELGREKQVVLQEIKMVDDTPDDLIHDLFAKKLWDGDALGNSVLGTAGSVSAFTRDDVVEYFSDRYHSGNTFVSVAGGTKHKNMVKYLEDSLNALPTCERGPVPAIPAVSCGVNIVKRDLEQVHLCMGVPAISSSHPDRFKYYLLSTILGGGMSSRLFQEIREKRGLAYSVYSYTNFKQNAGSFVVYAGTSAKDFKKVVNLIKKEWDGLRKVGVGREELRNAREQLKGALLLGLESSDSRMMKLARDEMNFGRVVKMEEIVEEIERVKPRHIKQVAQSAFSGERTALVALGRVTDKDLPAGFK